MEKTFFQKLAIGFSAAFALVYGTVYACGGGDWDWDWIWETNFTPETFVDEKYKPLFLSQELFYGSESLGNGATRFDEDISNDWAEYLKGKADLETIGYFLSSTANEEVEGIYTTKKSAKWAKKIDLKDKKVTAFFEFLHYGKIVERYSLNEESWGYDEAEPKKIEDASLLAAIEKKYNDSKDPFLKNRYWFQVMKAYFYSSKRADGLAFFDKTEAAQPKNTLYYRALSYAAGITGRMGNRAKSNYLYSQVFDKCPKLQTVAIFCFTPKEEKDWTEALAYAKTTDEKVALWAVQGYYADSERAISAIYGLNPKSDYLEFLLVRLINQEEVKANQDSLENTDGQDKKSIDKTISNSVVALIDRIAQSGKVNKPYLWNSAAGYLQTMDRNFAKADTYFAKAEKEMPKTELAIKQLRLLKFVNNLSRLDGIGPKVEKELVADLNWLYFELPQKEGDESVFRYIAASNWSKNQIASLYRNQKNPVMADLFARDPKFYHDNSRLLAMKAFLNKKEKTPFEEIAAKIYPLKIAQIANYQAVIATFRNNINDAIAFMEESGSETTFSGNPFNGSVKDCHDCDFAAYQKRKYTGLDFLKTIKVMQQALANNRDVYNNAMLLGNAFYNITHYGNGRTFHEGDIFGYGICPTDFDEVHRNIVTNSAVAKMYYQMAFKAADNGEQRARMQYMLAKCERNDFYTDYYKTKEYCWYISDKDAAFLEWKGFKNLKDNYSKTKFYQEVIAECGYFQTYISQAKK